MHAVGTGILAAESTAKSQRIAALDFAKGALVLFMVLYHWINYFAGPDWGHYRYLRFLSPSFIFISGFMISKVYLSKYEVVDFRLSRRLITRGVKLLAIFVALNLARVFMLPNISPGVALAHWLGAENTMAVFVTGNFTTKIVSFSILVPIAYLLLLAGILMPLFRLYKLTFHIVFVVFLLSALILNILDARSMNLEIVTMGMLGMVIGFVPTATIDKSVRHPYVLALAYILYTAAITVWNVPFPLVITGVCLSVAVIYMIGISGWTPTRIENVVDLLGKYSLFGYISQIAILQILAAGLRRFNQGSFLLVGSFIAAFTLTIISVEIMDRARRASTSADRLYKVVFN